MFTAQGNAKPSRWAEGVFGGGWEWRGEGGVEQREEAPVLWVSQDEKPTGALGAGGGCRAALTSFQQ